MARLQTIYREKIVPDLTAKFGYKSVMEVPRLTKITLNMGVSEAVADKKVMDHAVSEVKAGSLAWMLSALGFPDYAGEIYGYWTVIGTGNAVVGWDPDSKLKIEN